MPRTVAEPRIAALALARAQRLVHLGFQHRLHHAAHNLEKRIRLLRQQLFDSGYRRLNLGTGHGGVTRLSVKYPNSHYRLDPPAKLHNLPQPHEHNGRNSDVAADRRDRKHEEEGKSVARRKNMS